MPQDPRTYSPTTPEANRARQQGAGVGQRDLFEQRDPTRSDIATSPERTESFVQGEERTIGENAEDEASAAFDAEDDKPQETDPRFVGVPAGVDPHAFDQGDSPQLDWGEAEPDAVHGATHSRRPVKTEAERGQGPKTRSRNKQIVSGKPYG
jgi:hypothetical protein